MLPIAVLPGGIASGGVPSIMGGGLTAVICRIAIAAVIPWIAAVVTVAGTVTIGAGGQAADHRTGDQAAREGATPTPATPGFGWRRRRHRTKADRGRCCQNECCLFHGLHLSEFFPEQ